MGYYADRLPVGLPRMRGDRPQKRVRFSRSMRATPHARGSTFTPRQLTPMEIGYPACAGIDLIKKYPWYCLVWLPRMRGDRPATP